ncbi:IS3 family transposase [Ligilactobacillus salivarius]|nr:IS3 family transposase [Ligilactobacillus salivarius]MBE7392380.1 IS3 family transposase [Ligilactobacillus salivarius]NXZ96469.1 IS3 family transposase [Ligilactobacillus salivarius]NYA59181.1 IS3 family transposase [Ligilactobacillus salivarius]NYA61230.1 IS3 family transposase [Ligilactobacillus salivarius]
MARTIKEYIAFYNLKRYQTKLGSLAPAEYRALAA